MNSFLVVAVLLMILIMSVCGFIVMPSCHHYRLQKHATGFEVTDEALSLCHAVRASSSSLLTTLNMVPPSSSSSSSRRDLEDEIESRSRSRAAASQQQGVGGLAAGAILGGLVLGPFGALFGAQLGAQIGSKSILSRARQEEMERLGITQDMLDATKEIGFTLEQSIQGLEASRASLESQQRLARRLDQTMQDLYEKAKMKLSLGQDEEARQLLLERKGVEDKLKTTLKGCVAEKKRSEQMQANVQALEERAMEMDSLLRRTVGAKTMQNLPDEFSLGNEDPLLQKFRDMGID